MKQDKSVSNFLQIDVKGTKQAPAAQCEVVAVVPKAKSFLLHKDFKSYQDLAQKLHAASELSTGAGSACLVRFAGQKASHILFVGTGVDSTGVNTLGAVERMRRLGALVFQKLQAEKAKTAIVHLESFLLAPAGLSLDPTTAAYAFSEGMGLAAYKFKKYFTKKESDKSKPETVPTVTLVANLASRVKAFAKGVEQASGMLTGTYLCRDLSNEPSNTLYPEAYADLCKKVASIHGLKCTVLDEKALAKEKMGLLLGVGQGSVKPPRMVLLEYKPSKKAKKTIAFVGKGITFDSGGISLKPGARMGDMKHDMSGSAAVVGGIVAAAERKVNAHIIAIIVLAENMPSGNAIQPGNILVSRAGKTVEIDNTDAEGRLVLADALDYIQEMKPDYIIDLATLTGAITVTLGKAAAGLMGNDVGFSKLVQAAAKVSGERVWELPLFDEYFDDLKSDFADMRNTGDVPANGSQKGGMFLKQFIHKGTRWAHLDIAAMAYNVSNAPYYPRKTSSGYGVRLLVELASLL